MISGHKKLTNSTRKLLIQGGNSSLEMNPVRTTLVKGSSGKGLHLDIQNSSQARAKEW